MKIRITFKNPDAVSDAVDEAFKKLNKPDEISADEWSDIVEARKCDLSLSPWIEWMEYCTVEIDTEAKTAIVVPK